MSPTQKEGGEGSTTQEGRKQQHTREGWDSSSTQNGRGRMKHPKGGEGTIFIFSFSFSFSLSFCFLCSFFLLFFPFSIFSVFSVHQEGGAAPLPRGGGEATSPLLCGAAVSSSSYTLWDLVSDRTPRRTTVHILLPQPTSSLCGACLSTIRLSFFAAQLGLAPATLLLSTPHTSCLAAHFLPVDRPGLFQKHLLHVLRADRRRSSK